MDPVEYAKRGDVNYFKTVDLEFLLNHKAEGGSSLFCMAAAYGQLSCCEMIYKRCPSLLYSVNNSKFTALHQAAYNGFHEIAQFLISVSAEAESRGGGGEGLLFMVTAQKETALYVAIDRGFLLTANVLVQAVQADPSKLLQMVNWQNDSCMHCAVKHQFLDIVRLLSNTAPDLYYTFNDSGQTPLLIAFEQALTGTQNTERIRTLLLERQPDTCKIPLVHKEWTLLHLAASKGDLGTIEDIIRVCPHCLNLVDQEGQNFLHIAAKFEHNNIVKHIMGMRYIDDSILNGQDSYGNTPLHFAALSANTTMVLLLLYDSRVNKTIMNEQKQKAIDMITFDYDKRKAGVYGLTDRMSEREIKEQSDFDLLACALIATVSFTAGLTVPGGYFSDGDRKGTAILYDKISFRVFVLSNTVAMVLSLYAVFCHFCARRLLHKEDILYQLKVATFCSLFAIFAMMVTFIAGSYAVLATINEYAVTVSVLGGGFFICACRAMWRMLMQ